MSEDGVPVKLIIEGPDGAIETMEFAQGTIKIGRGRPGKKRKGVDVQLSDESVARVAAVLHVRGLNDVHVMDMGSGGTRIDGKAVGSRGKVISGTEILIGNTKVTAYIGDDAAKEYSAEFSSVDLDGDESIEALDIVEESVELGDANAAIQANISYEGLDGVALPDDDLPTQMASDGAQHLHADTGAQPAFGDASPASSTADHAGFAGQQGFDASAEIPQGSFGLPPASQDNPNVPEGFGMYPVHQVPTGYFGPVGPPPPPLPEALAPNMGLLLDVADRLGKENWLTQMPIW